MFSIIVAKDHNNIIGINGKLAYSFKKDLSFFKETTKKHTVVMGRNTYVSIGKPLEDRDNIILTRDASLEIDDCIVLYDKDTIQQFINDNKAFKYTKQLLYQSIFNCQKLRFDLLLLPCHCPINYLLLDSSLHYYYN